MGCPVSDPVDPKSPLASKMNIVAGLQLLASVLALVGGSELVQQFPKTAATLVGINASVLIVLRFFTSVPISW